MDEVNNTTAEETTKTAPELKHIYVEIESDLLAKPNALVDIILTQKVPTVVFCNQPSEADLIEVVLKKRNLNCIKLIGHVPPQKVFVAAQKVSAGEVSVLIVTDISAREINVGMFALLVNYSIHEDPEVYLHRMEHNATDSKLKTVLSLVSPLDHGSFHYLKKVVTFAFEKGELPDSREILSAQLEQILTEISTFSYPENQRFEQIWQLAKESPKSEEFFKYFFYQVLYVLPELKMKNAPRFEDKSYGRRSFNEGGEGEDNNGGEERQDRRGGRNDRNNRNDRNDRGDRGDRAPRQFIPKQDFIRFYLGAGKNQNFGKNETEELLSSAANLPANQISNYIQRTDYSFIDVMKENASGLDEILNGYRMSDGSSLVFKKATVITAPIPQKEGGEQLAATEEVAVDSENA